MAETEETPDRFDGVEAWYDAEIAPQLAAIAEECRRREVPFAAALQYSPTGYGETVVIPPKALPSNSAMRMATYGVRCLGNVDVLIGALMQDGEKHGHSSLFLNIIERATQESKKP